MTRIAFAMTYLLGAGAAVVLLNANIGAGSLAIAIWALVSVLLGWGTGRFVFAPLAFLAIPFAVPFGDPDAYRYSEPLPIWMDAVMLATISAFLILSTAFLKQTVEEGRRLRAASKRGRDPRRP